MTTATNQGEWAIESMRFRFQLGESQFYARHFDVAVLAARFLDIKGDPEAVVLPLDRFAGQVAAYAILSHPIARPLPVLSLQPRVIRYASHQYRRGFIRVEGAFDAYLATLSSNKRNQLKRKLKKLRERFGEGFRFEEYKEPASMREFHALARAVSAKTYQEKLFKKGLPEDDAFMADMDARARTNRARGWLLFDGPRPVAYLYAVIDDGFLTYDFVGYDPDYSEASPGNVLQYLILERVFVDKPCRIFDFGEGESQYKEFFSTDSMPCADIYYFPRDARGIALATSQAALFYLSRGIVHTLDRFGLKQRIKTMIRTGNVAALFEKASATGHGDGHAGDEGDGAEPREAKAQAPSAKAPSAKAPRAPSAQGEGEPRQGKPHQQGKQQQGREQQGREQQGREQQGREQQGREQQGREQQQSKQQQQQGMPPRDKPQEGKPPQQQGKPPQQQSKPQQGNPSQQGKPPQQRNPPQQGKPPQQVPRGTRVVDVEPANANGDATKHGRNGVVAREGEET